MNAKIYALVGVVLAIAAVSGCVGYYAGYDAGYESAIDDSDFFGSVSEDFDTVVAMKCDSNRGGELEYGNNTTVHIGYVGVDSEYGVIATNDSVKIECNTLSDGDA